LREQRPERGRVEDEQAMLIYSMSVSVDGFIADRKGAFGWTAPDEELSRFHTALVSELGGLVGELRMFRYPVVIGGGSRSCRRSAKRSHWT
jgi:hypothetical protein